MKIGCPFGNDLDGKNLEFNNNTLLGFYRVYMLDSKDDNYVHHMGAGKTETR